jgi:hypothetical protein
MTRVRRALHLAVLAGLAAPAAACGSGDQCSATTPLDATATTGSCGGFVMQLTNATACAFPDGGPTADQCHSLCVTTSACVVSGDQVTCIMACGKARTSLRWRRRKRGSALAEHLSASVWLEAASVHAFETLAEDLAAHGAPAALQRAARSAANDERRHARAMSDLAVRFGVSAPPPRRRKRPPQTLVALAIDNAVEGCVHETFGAALACFQALRARDPAARRAMRAIARDEARHAGLADAVARWAEARLSPRQRERLHTARSRAAHALARALRAPVPRELIDSLGMPTSAQARAMARELALHLSWD